MRNRIRDQVLERLASDKGNIGIGLGEGIGGRGQQGTGWVTHLGLGECWSWMA